MRKIFAVLLASVFSFPFLYAEYPDNKAKRISYECKVTGGLFVDTLFRAIPAESIGIDAARQKDKPEILDRINGYMRLSYKNESNGLTYAYTAALYTGGPENNRIFLMITRDESTLANFPYTAGSWVFEYAGGKCLDKTDVIASWWQGGGLVKLPQTGTDVEVCAMKGDDRGLREECTAYIWDLKNAMFIKKK
jgi:hypothetical protein